MNIATWLGFIGAAMLLVAFVFNQLRIWNRESFKYDFCNFLGGSFLVFYAWMSESYPFFLLNGVWTLFSLRDVVKDIFKK